MLRLSGLESNKAGQVPTMAVKMLKMESQMEGRANRASSDCSVMTREEVTGKSKFKKRSHDKSSQERIPSRMAKGAFGRHS